jgi:hypothetical protein
MVASLSENRQVFIVRVWRETREIEGADPEWRGSIEHVPDGERHYFKDLNELADLISLYAPGMRRDSE